MKKEATMKRNASIEYWWKCSKFKVEMPECLEEALEETAMERIRNMMADGYVSGELYDNVNMKIEGRKTPEDGWECYGWWKVVYADGKDVVYGERIQHD